MFCQVVAPVPKPVVTPARPVARYMTRHHGDDPIAEPVALVATVVGLLVKRFYAYLRNNLETA